MMLRRDTGSFSFLAFFIAVPIFIATSAFRNSALRSDGIDETLSDEDMSLKFLKYDNIRLLRNNDVSIKYIYTQLTNDLLNIEVSNKNVRASSLLVDEAVAADSFVFLTLLRRKETRIVLHFPLTVSTAILNGLNSML